MECTSKLPTCAHGAGKLQIQSPASGLAADSPPASAKAVEAAGAQREQQHGRAWPGQRDSAESALLKEASHMAAQKSRGPDEKRSSLVYSSRGPPVTRHFATSSAEESSLPLQGSRLLSGEGSASSSSMDEVAQPEQIGLYWQAGGSGLPTGLYEVAETRQPLHSSNAPEVNKGVLSQSPGVFWSASQMIASLCARNMINLGIPSSSIQNTTCCRTQHREPSWSGHPLLRMSVHPYMVGRLGGPA